MKRPPTAKSILIVDDDRSVSAKATRILRGESYHVHPPLHEPSGLDKFLLGHRVDAMVLAVVFPGGVTSLPLLPALKTRFPSTAIIIHTAFPHEASPHQVFLDGALGYLVKRGDLSFEELPLAVECVLKGLPYVTRVMRMAKPSSSLGATFQRPDLDKKRDLLAAVLARAPHKRRIVDGVRRGLCNCAIAKEIGCSEHTVHSLLSVVYEKVGAEGRVELAVIASALVIRID